MDFTTRLTRSAVLPAMLIISLLATACSGRSEPAALQLADSANSALLQDRLPDVLGLDEIVSRSSSASTNQNGIAYLLKDDLAEAGDGFNLDLKSTSSAASWAIYRYSLPQTCKASGCAYTTGAEPGEETQAYLAIADYSTGRWRFAADGIDSMELDEDYGTFSSPAGYAYVAVVAFRGTISVANVSLDDHPIPQFDGWVHSFDSGDGSQYAEDLPIETHMEPGGNLLAVGRSHIGSPPEFYYSLLIRFDQDGNLLATKEIRLMDDSTPLWLVDRPYVAIADNGDIYLAAAIDEVYDDDDGEDLMLMRMDSSFNPIWVRTLTGPEREAPNAIAVDGSGNVVVIGRSTWDTVLPKPDITQFSFAFKVSAAGELQWNRTFEPVTPTERPLHVLCDQEDDSISVHGIVGTGDGFFIARMDPGGNLQSSHKMAIQDTSTAGTFLLEANGDIVAAVNESSTNPSFGDPELKGQIIMRIGDDGSIKQATLIEISDPSTFFSNSLQMHPDVSAGLIRAGTLINEVGVQFYNSLFYFSATDLSYSSNIRVNGSQGPLYETDNGDFIFSGAISPFSRCRDLAPVLSSSSILETDLTGVLNLAVSSLSTSDTTGHSLETETRILIEDSSGTLDPSGLSDPDRVMVRYNRPPT